MDFLDLGPRAAVDKALQRLARSNDICRIDRGLYDVPTVNLLTGKATTPDYTAIINAVARRDQIRILVDGLTAANRARSCGCRSRPCRRSHRCSNSPHQTGQAHDHFQAHRSQPPVLGGPTRYARRAGLTLAARFIAYRPDQNPEAAAVHHFRSGARSRNPPGSGRRYPHTAYMDAESCPRRDWSALLFERRPQNTSLKTMNDNFLELISAKSGERRDLFLAASTRLGTTEQNVEKDFWVCWVLDALFHGLPPDGPRLLFKGGTSLSKAFG